MKKFRLDFAPKENGKEFNEWCKKYNFHPLNSDRRAWCPDLKTYFKGSDGVIIYETGDIDLFHEEDGVIYDDNDCAVLPENNFT